MGPKEQTFISFGITSVSRGKSAMRTSSLTSTHRGICRRASRDSKFALLRQLRLHQLRLIEGVDDADVPKLGSLLASSCPLQLGTHFDKPNDFRHTELEGQACLGSALQLLELAHGDSLHVNDVPHLPSLHCATLGDPRRAVYRIQVPVVGEAALFPIPVCRPTANVLFAAAQASSHQS